MKDRLFIIIQYLTPQQLLSRAAGVLANSKIHFIKNTFITFFAKRFQVDMTEAVQPDLSHYENFNDFFTRALRDNARPISATQSELVCPADGAISQLGAIDDDKLFQAKGRLYDCCTLLGGNKQVSKQFEQGSFITVYLSPRDYHRVHMPIDGTLLSSIYIPGDLFSVNQVTAENVPNLFARNERLVCLFDTPAGPMAMILVGAMIVAGIETVWAGNAKPPHKGIHRIDWQQQHIDIRLSKGEEMGRFKLGSTVILLFGRHATKWTTSLAAGSTLKMGQTIGAIQ